MIRLLAPIVLLLEALWFYAPVLFTNRHAISFDLEGYHLPLAGFLTASLRRGEFPLWDPYTYCGQPFFANIQTQLFYPPAWPFLVLGAWSRHNLFRYMEHEVVLHVLLAGLFAYLLLRQLGLTRGSALFGATVFQLGGFFASQPQHLGAVCGTAWLPLAWYAVLRLREGVTGGRIALLACTVGLSLLAGFPSTTAVVIVSTLLLGLFSLNPRALGAAGLACVLGTLLAAVAWLPAAELSGLSIAGKRGEWSDTGGGVPLEALVSMVQPNHYDIFDRQKYEARKLPWNPSFLYLYCGLAAVVLAPLALVLSRHKLRFPIALVTLASALWMLCDNTPVGRTLFPHLPRFFRGAVYSEFAMPAFLLGVAVLAALGAERALSRRHWVCAGALVLLTACDLIHAGANSWMNSGEPPGLAFDEFDHSKRALQQMRAFSAEIFPPGRVDVLAAPRGWATSNAILEIPSANGDDPLALWRFLQLRLCFADGPFWTRYYELSKPASPLLDLLNVRFVITNPQQNLDTAKFLRRDDLREGSRVWQNRDVLPRFFLVRHLQPATGLTGALALLKAPGFDPTSMAVVENVPGAVPAAAGGTVWTVRYAASALELVVDAPAASFLVTSETYYPGWRAWIDGREQPLVLTNAAFRGLAVPAGEHRIAMRFQPRILYYGAAISLLTLVLLAAAVKVSAGGSAAA